MNLKLSAREGRVKFCFRNHKYIDVAFNNVTQQTELISYRICLNEQKSTDKGFLVSDLVLVSSSSLALVKLFFSTKNSYQEFQ